MKTLLSEIMASANARSYKTRRVLRNLDNLSQSDALKEYEQAVSNWNDKLVTFGVQLTMFVSSSYASQLEDNLQPRFVEISQKLDTAIALKRANKAIPAGLKTNLEHSLNHL
ncbi:MAG TPA: hypothetical protein VIM58_10155, partial [Candidatus Methylacidiphilales bacterium]